MNSLRRIFLLISAISLTSGVQAQLPSIFGSDEKRAQSIAEKTFQDGLYDVALSKLQSFLEAYPESPAVPQIRWLLGQTLLFTGEPNKALEILSKPPAGISPALLANYQLWEGEALAALDRWADAEKKFRDWIQKHGDNENLTLARISLANALFKQNKLEAALGLLNEIRLGDLQDRNAQRGTLLQVRILLAEGKVREAEELLNELNRQRLTPPASFEVAYWSAELAKTKGDNAGAQSLLEKLVSDPRASPRDLVAQSHFLLGQIQSKSGNQKAAAESFRKAFTTTYDPKTLEPAINLYLKAQKENKELTSGALVVRDFINQRGPSAAVGLYAIARYFASDGNLDAAMLELDNLAKTFPDSEWNGPGRLLMAEALAKKGKTKEAEALLTKIRQEQAGKPLGRTAALQLAEMRVRSGDATDAAALFLEVAKDPDGALAEQAYQRALLSYAKAGLLEPFLETETRMRQRFPKSALLKPLAFEKARLLEASGKADEARTLLASLAGTDAPQNENTATAIMNLGYSHFRAADYPAATAHFEDFLKRFPTHPSAPEVRFWLIQANSFLGARSTETERTEMQALLQTLGKHPLAPQIAFQVAQSYFNEQNYAEAQRQFQKVSQDYPTAALADQAIYLAGRSAMNLGNHTEAIALLEKIKPDSPAKNDARLAQIRCFLLQGKPDPALAIADSLIKANPSGSYFAEAHLRRINALLAQADLKQSSDPLTKALDSAQTIIKFPLATTSQRNEAGCLRGEILQRQGKSQEALEAYLDVVYGRLFDQATGQAQPEFLWFVRAGTQAARIKLEQEDIRGAVAIYRILERLGGPSRKVFRDTIEDLRSKHFIWEES
jgi:TolA-binding protein